MFNVRQMEEQYRDRYFLQYSAANDDIPLKKNWSERWTTLLVDFKPCLEQLLQLEVRSDDVFISTFMRCGTTWMQEAAWLLLNNLDFNTAKNVGLLERSIFVDLAGLYKGVGDPLEDCKKLKSPRLIKSHLPANLLPQQIWQKKPKIIYVARNVKDVVVSAYHFIKGLGFWRGDISDFVDDFLNDSLMYAPYWSHTIEFWQMRNEPNIFFVTYEDMKRDLASVLQRLCTFLERPELDDEQLRQMLEYLSFDRMKESKTAKVMDHLKGANCPKLEHDFQLVRRGEVGSFKDELTPQLQKKVDDWSNKYLDKYGLKQEDIFGKI